MIAEIEKNFYQEKGEDYDIDDVDQERLLTIVERQNKLQRDRMRTFGHIH